MSEELQSILIEELEIAWPGFRLRRVALNRHMPRVERLSEHVHAFHQFLLYLGGHGVQHVEESAIPVARGALLLVPAGARHRFVKEGARRPVCLAVDFEADLPADWNRQGVLRSGELSSIESWLVSLHEWVARGEGFSIASASLVLQILTLVQISLRASASGGPVHASVLRAASRLSREEWKPGAIAGLLGRSLDHLNRQLRAESGRTVGDILNEMRLQQCARLLRDTGLGIGEVATAIGFDDQNYFARWFRRHTGQTPTGWRVANGEAQTRSAS